MQLPQSYSSQIPHWRESDWEQKLRIAFRRRMGLIMLTGHQYCVWGPSYYPFWLNLLTISFTGIGSSSGEEGPRNSREWTTGESVGLYVPPTRWPQKRIHTIKTRSRELELILRLLTNGIWCSGIWWIRIKVHLIALLKYSDWSTATFCTWLAHSAHLCAYKSPRSIRSLFLAATPISRRGMRPDSRGRDQVERDTVGEKG